MLIYLLFIIPAFIHNQRFLIMSRVNFTNQVNSHRTSHHPSQQSTAQPYRPSIKVGYKVIPYISQEKRLRKRVEPFQQLPDKQICRKMVDQTKNHQCGKFVNSEYIKQSEKQNFNFQKKSVVESRQKYQKGDSVRQRMKNQPQKLSQKYSTKRSASVASITSSRSKSSLNQLPSYQNTGIKDIMEYQHALPYRQVPITKKCTNITALSRFCKYSDIHDFDFRKRIEVLR